MAMKNRAHHGAAASKETPGIPVKRVSGELVPPEFGRFMRPFEEMERWFEEAFRRPTLFPAWMPRIKFPEPGEISPSVDIYEEKGEVVVKAELAGLSKEDIEVSVAEDVITISGEKKGEEKVERKDFHYHERSFGSFTRRFRLPPGTQTDKAKASFKDGVLMVRIPKSAAAGGKSRKLKME